MHVPVFGGVLQPFRDPSCIWAVTITTAVSFFSIPAFKCLSRTICISDRLLRPPVPALRGGVFGGYRWLRKRLVLIITGYQHKDDLMHH